MEILAHVEYKIEKYMYNVCVLHDRDCCLSLRPVLDVFVCSHISSYRLWIQQVMF